MTIKNNVKPENDPVMIDMVAVEHWASVDRPAVQQARWLTAGLVSADILPESFRDTRVAPVVIGKTSVMSRGDTEQRTFISSGIDLEYLAHPPKLQYWPHERIKKSVDKKLSGFEKGARKRSNVLFPGYVFPDVAGGTLYLDGKLCDASMDSAELRPIIRRIAAAYELGGICVGTEALVKNNRTFVPFESIPSVIREALRPNRANVIEYSTSTFRRASKTIGSMK